jgi:hypothetical protein
MTKLYSKMGNIKVKIINVTAKISVCSAGPVETSFSGAGR